MRYQRYVRRSDVAGVRRACDAYRETQKVIRAGRENYRGLLRRLRELLPLLDGARKAGLS